MTDSIDYDSVMQANISRVFSERNASMRIAAIRELYADDATLYEPHAAVTGHEAISDAVAALLASLPTEFVFVASGPAVGHHGAARLRWQSGPAGGPAVVTGTDVATFADGRIASLYVFLDPAEG